MNVWITLLLTLLPQLLKWLDELLKSGKQLTSTQVNKLAKIRDLCDDVNLKCEELGV